MMRSAALCALATVAACSEPDAPPTANAAAVIAHETIVAPINATTAARASISKPPPPMTRPNKPLVSRETPRHQIRKADYRAIGTEPFWAVTVNLPHAVLERPDRPPARFAVRMASGPRAIRYQGDGFDLTATEGPCSDGMSDAVWSDRVQVAFADGTLKGCGGVRDDMREERP